MQPKQTDRMDTDYHFNKGTITIFKEKSKNCSIKNKVDYKTVHI